MFGGNIATSFIRWAGAKRRHAAMIASMAPPFRTYYEPFMGSASLYFYLEPHQAVLGDTCAELVSAFHQVRHNAPLVFETYSNWSVDRETFNYLRHLSPTSPIEAAARFIYLNKTCWNGLYRVNSKGQFNVPYGRPKSTNITPLSTLLACAKVLSTAASICHADFQETAEPAQSGDLVYFDPPYVTRSKTDRFIEYNHRLFSWDDQIRLAKLCSSLRQRGVHVLISNADHEEIKALYADFEIFTLHRKSTLASAPHLRGNVTELVIRG